MTETEGKIMKKILIATTALVATAGVAAAEISITGYARFGGTYTEGVAPRDATAAEIEALDTATDTVLDALDDGDVAAALAAGDDVLDAAAAIAAAEAGADDEFDLEQRYHLRITGTTTTDAGLSLGAFIQIRSDDATGASRAGTLNAPTFTAGMGDLEMVVGNINGAMDDTPGLYNGSVGLTGLSYANVVTGFNTHDFSDGGVGTNGIQVKYNANGLGLNLSNAHDGDTEFGVSYALNGITLAATMSNTTTAANTEWLMTAQMALGSVNIGLATAESVAGDGATTLSIGGSAAPGLSYSAYVARNEAAANESAAGVGIVYDLGGGASFRGGIAGTHGRTRADAGIQFTF
jgi:outer membrane protein OmpU